MRNLGHLVAKHSTGTYAVTRRARATTTRGRKVAGATSSFTAKLSVQPLSGADLMRLPEGMRASETMKVYSSVKLQTAGDDYEPDTIAIDGEVYEVKTAEGWNLLGGYWKAMVERTGRT